MSYSAGLTSSSEGGSSSSNACPNDTVAASSEETRDSKRGRGWFKPPPSLTPAKDIPKAVKDSCPRRKLGYQTINSRHYRGYTQSTSGASSLSISWIKAPSLRFESVCVTLDDKPMRIPAYRYRGRTSGSTLKIP